MQHFVSYQEAQKYLQLHLSWTIKDKMVDTFSKMKLKVTKKYSKHSKYVWTQQDG